MIALAIIALAALALVAWLGFRPMGPGVLLSMLTLMAAVLGAGVAALALVALP